MTGTTPSADNPQPGVETCRAPHGTEDPRPQRPAEEPHSQGGTEDPRPHRAADAPAVEEKDEFDVVLESFGDKKIAVVKVVKNLTGLGLKEAKDLVESAPSTLFENAKKEDAEKAKAEIEEAGGKVTLK